jgi:N-acetylglutamate synthase-like GNAT family acetyltransferase
MKIRPASEADSARIASLLGELGYLASENQIRDRLDSAPPSSTVNLVAESDHGILACLSACLIPYFPDGSTLCRITALVVASGQRGTGVGVALVEATAEYAREHGC